MCMCVVTICHNLYVKKQIVWGVCWSSVCLKCNLTPVFTMWGTHVQVLMYRVQNVPVYAGLWAMLELQVISSLRVLLMCMHTSAHHIWSNSGLKWPLNGPGQLTSWTVRPCREKKNKGAKVAHLIKRFWKTKSQQALSELIYKILSIKTSTDSRQLWPFWISSLLLFSSFMSEGHRQWRQELSEILFPSPCCAPL